MSTLLTNHITDAIIKVIRKKGGEKMNIPRGVKFIIERLNENGNRADIVGGCVRDRLLGKTPDDYDITTDATPEVMREVFFDLRVIDTGIKHGTLTVIVDSIPYEITTYRLDGEYSDGRHPDSVSFTKLLSDDLARRDFTINAMCYNEKDGYTDLFFGRRDLDLRIIRAVGDPVRRFSEDALRILRALRFASTLDFEIEEATARAIFAKKELLLKVSAERIFTEWKKLIAGVGAYRVIKEYSEVISLIIPELDLKNLPDEKGFSEATPEIRELSLFAIGAQNPKEAYISSMQRLRSDNSRKGFGASVLDSYTLPTNDKTAIHLLLVRCGGECAEGVLRLKALLGMSDARELTQLNALLGRGACYRISDLKINGDDLKSLGIRGKDIGDTLNKLLYAVVTQEVKNDGEELISFVKFTLDK